MNDGEQMILATGALSEEAELIEIARWATAESISSYAAAMDSLMEEGKP